MSFNIELCLNLLDELKEWINAWDRMDEVKETEYFVIKQQQNKGFGMISKKFIAAHTILLAERPVLFETKQSLRSIADRSKSTSEFLESQFESLPPKKQAIVLNLANVFGEEKENEIEGIYDTSACQTTSSSLHISGLFPTFARINHSCRPNCTFYYSGYPTNALIVKTLFDIEPNTELTVSYLPRFKCTFIERQRLLMKRYRFECRCALCREGRTTDAVIKEYRTAIMNGNRHWNCIQTALEIINTHFESFPTSKANLLSSAIDCATDSYRYDEAHDLIVEAIQLNSSIFGLHCRRWGEIHGQITRLISYCDDERFTELIDKYKCLWHNI